MTTTDIAKLLGITPARVRQLILAGRLPAEKNGRDWYIRKADLAKIANRKPGRPKK